MTVRIEHADCLEAIPRLVAEGVLCDAVVTDPPYGLEFMGKEWDGSDGFRRSLNSNDVGRNNVFGRTSQKAPEYRTAGVGRKGKPGIGERQTDWVSNAGWNSSRCGLCGHLFHGGSPCRCDNPQPIHADNRWHLFQEWTEAWARAAFEILRPGGFLVAFGGTRTHHRMVCGIEDAGFVIQDTIAWLYGSGFPKHRSQLKPAHEPICLAYKPGGKRTMQINECRVRVPGGNEPCNNTSSSILLRIADPACCISHILRTVAEYEPQPAPPCPNDAGCARSWSLASSFPRDCQSCRHSRDALSQMVQEAAQLASPLRRDARADTDHHHKEWLRIRDCLCNAHRAIWDDFLGSLSSCTYMHDGTAAQYVPNGKNNVYGSGMGGGQWNEHALGRWPANVTHDGSAEVLAAFPESNGQRSEIAERGKRPSGFGNIGAAKGDPIPNGPMYGDTGSAARFFYSPKASKQDRAGSKHPTVKPVNLIAWLVALVTPPGGTFLDPFAGSGTAAAAALKTGRNAILIEREAQYVADIQTRIASYRDEDVPHRTAPKPRRKAPLLAPSLTLESLPLFARPYDEAADLHGSYYAAIEEVGRRVKAGEPVPECLLPKR